jgi:hypothetical protein
MPALQVPKGARAQLAHSTPALPPGAYPRLTWPRRQPARRQFRVHARLHARLGCQREERPRHRVAGRVEARHHERADLGDELLAAEQLAWSGEAEAHSIAWRASRGSTSIVLNLGAARYASGTAWYGSHTPRRWDPPRTGGGVAHATKAGPQVRHARRLGAALPDGVVQLAVHRVQAPLRRADARLGLARAGARGHKAEGELGDVENVRTCVAQKRADLLAELIPCPDLPSPLPCLHAHALLPHPRVDQRAGGSAQRHFEAPVGLLQHQIHVGGHLAAWRDGRGRGGGEGDGRRRRSARVVGRE